MLRTWRAARGAAATDWPPAPKVATGRVCPHCHRPVAGDAKLCPACGTRLLVSGGGPPAAQAGCLVLALTPLTFGLYLLAFCAAVPVLGGLAGVFHDSPLLFVPAAGVVVVLALLGRD